jgi:hypothetical protein
MISKNERWNLGIAASKPGTIHEQLRRKHICSMHPEASEGCKNTGTAPVSGVTFGPQVWSTNHGPQHEGDIGTGPGIEAKYDPHSAGYGPQTMAPPTIPGGGVQHQDQDCKEHMTPIHAVGHEMKHSLQTRLKPIENNEFQIVQAPLLFSRCLRIVT